MRTAYLGLAFCALMIASVLFPASSKAQVNDRHRAVVEEVFQRLIAVMDKPEGWEVWPPEISVIDPGFANAFAGFRVENGMEIPYIEVTVTTIEEIARFDPDVLAYTIGHELGHHHHRHSHQGTEFRRRYGNDLALIRTACDRQGELDADLFGMQLALKAGYSRQGLMKDLQAWRTLTPPYCRFEGLELEHPPWEERAAFLLRGENQEVLWRSLSAFQTGVMFLENQHFNHAQLCFRNVTKEFPECHEAWANLGYALLMQYCDALEVEDLRALDVGHLVVGGFYRRPASLEPDVRGADERLWFEAVGAFREALRLKQRLNFEDDLLMVKANLAVAYLVHPSGKDVGQAEEWFAQVFEGLKDPEKAKKLDPLVHAAILINSGAARGFDGELVGSTLQLLAQARTDRTQVTAVNAVESALRFNQARSLVNLGAPGERATAMSLYEQYLDGMTSSSAWWPIAYQEYVQLASALGATPKAEKQFRKLGIADWRPLTGLMLPDGTEVVLSDRFADVLGKLGPADAIVPVIEGSNLKFYRYAKFGISILATHEVLAIVMDSDAAPQLKIRRPGLSGDEVELALGMPRAKLEQLLGGDWDVELARLFDMEERHQLYRSLGLAVQFKDGVVSEFVIAVVPISGS
jgi:tetratricopeptide (TPR) repeat protein